MCLQFVHRYYTAYGLGLDTGHFRVHSALRRRSILPLDTAWFCMVTVLLNTKTARIKGVLQRDNALSAYRLWPKPYSNHRTVAPRY